MTYRRTESIRREIRSVPAFWCRFLMSFRIQASSLMKEDYWREITGREITGREITGREIIERDRRVRPKETTEKNSSMRFLTLKTSVSMVSCQTSEFEILMQPFRGAIKPIVAIRPLRSRPENKKFFQSKSSIWICLGFESGRIGLFWSFVQLSKQTLKCVFEIRKIFILGETLRRNECRRGLPIAFRPGHRTRTSQVNWNFKNAHRIIATTPSLANLCILCTPALHFYKRFATYESQAPRSIQNSIIAHWLTLLSITL